MSDRRATVEFDDGFVHFLDKNGNITATMSPDFYATLMELAAQDPDLFSVWTDPAPGATFEFGGCVFTRDEPKAASGGRATPSYANDKPYYGNGKILRRRYKNA